MSNKKKRNRVRNLESGDVNPLAFEDKPTAAQNQVESSLPDKTGWIAYLKTHWWATVIIAFLSLGVLGAGLKYLEEDAQRQKAVGLSNDKLSLLSKVNPFVPAPRPSPTPQLSKEYIYAGGKLLAVEDANPSASPGADLAIWRPSTGTWWVMAGAGTQGASQAWGTTGDVPVQGDYDGDNKADFAVFRPSTNVWWILKSSDSNYYSVTFGTSGDVVTPADFDGDGKTDVAVYRSSNTTWYINQSSTTNTVSTQFGGSSDTAIPADFDGDGKADIATWRNSTHTFYSLNSSNGGTQTTSYGVSGDKPVCADYDGDGRADLGVWRTSDHTWYYQKSSNGNGVSYQWGIATDLPVQKDYDGDGKVDMALYRAVDSGSGDVGKWYIYQSSNGNIRQEQWGIANDIPVPAYYRR
jgi:hypothetical protein